MKKRDSYIIRPLKQTKKLILLLDTQATQELGVDFDSVIAFIHCRTYTLAWGFFFEKSQARPRSDILTWPCSSSRILAGCKPREKKATLDRC